MTEGNAGTANATFTVSLQPPAARRSRSTAPPPNGTAIAPGDYTAVPATLSRFAPGQTDADVHRPGPGDPLDEVNETFFVNLSNATNATIADGQGVGTIIDDDGRPPSRSTT